MKYLCYCLAAGWLIVSTVGNAQSGVPAKKLIAEFRIDGAKEEFTNVFQILPQSNGDVTTFSSEETFARLYSAKGALKKKFMRKGAGPGEVKNVGSVGMLADSIWVFDYELRRISLFEPNGSFLRSWQMKPPGAWRDASPERKYFLSIAPAALLPNNVAIGRTSTAASALASGEVTTRPILRMSWEGIVSGVVNDMPVAARAMMVRMGDAVSYGQQPFDNSPASGVSPDGTQIVIVDMKSPGKEPFVFVTRISPKGDTLSRSKVPFTPDPVTSRTIDSTVNAETVQRKRPETESQFRASLYVAPYWPPVVTVLVANDGASWLLMHARDGSKHWMVVSPQGKPTAAVEVPKNVRIMRIDRGIWGTELDTDDVPSVVRYKVSN
ncbi:MAG: hypothetical protein ABJB74_20455 [Gemmatimonas sp.]